MPTLDELLVKIDASTELLRRELKKGEGSVTKFQNNVDRKLDRVDKRFSRLGSTFRSALASFGVAFSVGGIVVFAKEAANAAKQIENLSALSGLGAEQFQRHAFAARNFGVEQEKLSDILKDVNDKMGDFLITGQGPLADFFETVGKDAGLTADAFRGLTSSEVLQKYVNTLQEANVSQQEMTFFMEAIANDATLLIPLFKDNAQALKEMGAEAKGVLSDEQIAKGAALTEVFRDMSSTVGGTLKGAFIEAAFAASEFFALTEESSLRKEISATRDEIEQLQRDIERGVKTVPGSGFGGPFGFEAQEFGMREAQRGAEVAANEDQISEARIRLAEKTAELAQAEQRLIDLRSGKPTASTGGTDGSGRRTFTITDIEGPEEREAPLFVRAGESQPPSRDEVDEVREQLRALEEQALRSQGRMEEAIRMSADRQIEEWRRVAEQTPEFADQAARAIELINERAAAEIEDVINEANPAIQQFASQFAAAFESRGIDALLAGDISDAVKGLAKDIAELVLRLVILKPLAESLGGLFGGGIFGGLGGGTVPIPAFAGGGRPPVGRASIVGEEAPELFVPDVPGRIFNATQLKRMSGSGIVINQENNTQAGLPPQWQAQQAMAARIAAVAARDAVLKELGGRR